MEYVETKISKFSSFSAWARTKWVSFGLPWQIAICAVLTALVVLVAILLLPKNSIPTSEQFVNPVPHIVYPADGDLVSGDTKIAQLMGQCDTTAQCHYLPNNAPATLTIPSGGSIPIKADQSILFTASINGGPEPYPTVTVSNGQLKVVSSTAGTWPVTLVGREGGVWGFNINVTVPPPSR